MNANAVPPTNVGTQAYLIAGDQVAAVLRCPFRGSSGIQACTRCWSPLESSTCAQPPARRARSRSSPLPGVPAPSWTRRTIQPWSSSSTSTSDHANAVRAGRTFHGFLDDPVEEHAATGRWVTLEPRFDLECDAGLASYPLEQFADRRGDAGTLEAPPGAVRTSASVSAPSSGRSALPGETSKLRRRRSRL